NKAVELMNQALAYSNTTNKAYSERELEILLNIAHLYVDLGNYKKAIKQYEHIRTILRKIPYIRNNDIKIGLYYNLSRVHLFLDNLNEAKKYAKLGINICIKTQSL